MKNMKKLFALVLALALCFSLALPAMAADTDTRDNDLTVNGKTTGRTLDVYQILKANKAENSSVLTDIEWGSSIKGGEGETAYDYSAQIIDNLKNKGVVTNEDGTQSYDFATEFASVTSATQFVEKIQSFDNKGIRMDAVADAIFDVLASQDAAEGENSLRYAEMIEGTAATYTTKVADGYYMIRDRDGSQEGENDFYTKALLAVAGDVSVTVKGDVPEVNKTVSEANRNYAERVAQVMAKTYYYKWVGTLPEDIRDYKEYSYKFYDTLPEGVALIDTNNLANSIESVQIVSLGEGNSRVEINMPMKGVNESEAGYVLNWDAEKNQFTLAWDDLMAAYQEATDDDDAKLVPSDKIEVIYKAKLTSDASLSVNGLTNEVYLEFSNSPNGDGVGKTPEDDAVVFTFGLNVVKVDSKDATKYLAGAEFILYHEVTKEGGSTELEYAILSEPEVNANGADVYTITGWTTTKPGDDAQKIVSVGDKDGILIKGLDAEVVYYLQETKAPTNYNLPFNPTKFMINPVIDKNDAGKWIVKEVDYTLNDTKVDSNVAAVNNAISLTITNGAGTTLPSTGGMGTTLFYVAGGILVVAAVILLVTKKRMGAEN